MKGKWLSKGNNSSCILFFNGWGMDANAVRELDLQGFDLYHLSEYDGMPTPDWPLINYQNCYVVAWSLGVSYANLALTDASLSIDKAIALNGTPFPMHDQWGIPEAIFENTLSNWDDRNRTKFNLRMMGGKAALDESAELMSQRSTQSQKDELQFFYDQREAWKETSTKWDEVYIGANDRIIPASNQYAYWKDKTTLTELDCAHFPFHRFSSWAELLKIKV